MQHKAQPHTKARLAYHQGNAYFAAKRYDDALNQWRHATRLWLGLPGREKNHAPTKKELLKAALTFVAVVLVAHLSLYWLFPRPLQERRALANALARNHAPWWQKFLETGRPQTQERPGDAPSLSEWWRRFQLGRNQKNTPQPPPGLALEKRWRDLILKRLRSRSSLLQPLNRHVVSGFGLSQHGEYAVAVQVLTQGLNAVNDPLQQAELWQTLANVHYGASQNLQLDGLATYDLPLVKKAIHAYKQALKRVPDPVGHGNIGWMYYLLGDYSKAKKHSLTALVQNPQLQYVQLNLGLVLIAQQKHEEAIGVYEQVLQQAPSLETLYGGINDLQEMLRDHAQKWPFANLPLALLAVQAGNVPVANQALNALQRASKVAPKWRRAGQFLQNHLNAFGSKPKQTPR